MIQRYEFFYDELAGDSCQCDMKEDDSGKYIKYEDYKKERDEMLKLLIEADKEICLSCKRLNPNHYNCTYCYERESRLEFIEKVTGLSIDKALEENNEK